jgi:RND family efflux transporter MFP subunit
MRLFILSIPLILLAGLIACSKAPGEARSSTRSEEAIPVRLAPVQRRPYVRPVEASGLVAAGSEARLSFKTGGVIRQILTDEGQTVRAGQLLAVLDMTEIDAQVSQARTGLQKAERDLARIETLYADSAATYEAVQNLTSARDAARETVNIAEFNRKFSEIRAPMSGRIVRKLMNEGELAGPGTPVLYMTSGSASDWILRTGVSDKDWARLQAGDRAQVRLDAYPDAPVSGTVSLIPEAADPMSGLYPVEIRLSPGQIRLAPGLFGRVNITPSGSRQLFFIPVEALVEGNGRQAFVYVPDSAGARARKVAIEALFVEQGEVAVLSGLEQIPQVIAAGSPYLADQAAIQVINP